MTIESLKLICYVWLAIAMVVSVIMFFVTAPFGRHVRDGWGISINNNLAWFIMELPSLSIMAGFLFFGHRAFQSYVWILFVPWIIHYFNRTFVYPLRIRPTPKKMPVVIMASAICFNMVNAGLNGYYLTELASPEDYSANWLSGFSFWAGAVLFVTGIIINWKADNILIHLRQPGETGYRIPRGFLFDYVSSPNLLGEIVEWSGFALMAWNLPAMTFFVWTLANLTPRAKNHHDWYHRNFKEYPPGRKALFPFIF